MMFAVQVFRRQKTLFYSVIWMVLALSAQLTPASQSVLLTWQASPVPAVSGYRIYYGPASGYYTNYVTAGNVTNLTICGLEDGSIYFFAAKSYDSTGTESGFSNETIFTGATAQPAQTLYLSGHSLSASGLYQFSLAPGAPAGLVLNSTNANVVWTPSPGFASTTNRVQINFVNPGNPTVTNSETLMIAVGDYFNIQTGPLVAAVGQTGQLPITLASSTGSTNIEFELAWPSTRLLNPTLSTALPQVYSSVQNFGTYLLLHFWTTSGQIPPGTNQIGLLTFQVASQSTSASLALPVANANVVTASAKTEPTPLASPGSVILVGSQPLLQPVTTLTTRRTINIYAAPESDYQLQISTNLATWTTILIYSQTNLTHQINLPYAGPSVFYRVIK